MKKKEKRRGKKKDEHICASQRSTCASSIFVAGDLLHPTPKRQERPWRRWSCFVPQPPGDRHQDVVETATRTSTSYPYLAAEQVMSTREKTTESLPDTSPLCRRACVCVCVCVCERACCGRCFSSTRNGGTLWDRVPILWCPDSRRQPSGCPAAHQKKAKDLRCLVGGALTHRAVPVAAWQLVFRTLPCCGRLPK
ncbi:hypothetical protein M441DRAFT_263360 [Trichoderma asperellum CBS 433.97]|uniref:Uncharacterized protein n=1 Tax=Trichoderma asperellum (strain ATCC 204424 / CBS 433.97 / NBRC 101777) TaxID=1042311 RepID=A0A2T3YXD0_TRIA4|nr:hypothetical protein M441DRAFT_263360 [Trichoderma asperellum CBS 433.97]PTB37206.1 hypothetical protein M441DRAFT_263360 [Trichoderma asperellum CBS 433.97]